MIARNIPKNIPASAQCIISPKRPKGRGWYRATWWTPPAGLLQLGYPVEAWQHIDGFFALSAVEVATPEPGERALGPEYHLSLSRNGQRVDSKTSTAILKQFELEDATEDNHVPGGKVRNFWRPVADSLSGYECPCVDNEPAIREDKGDFVWRGTSEGK